MERFSHNLQFIHDVLELFELADSFHDLTWRTEHKGTGVQFWVNCNDLFYWGTADAEPVETKKDLELLRQTLSNLQNLEKENITPMGVATSRVVPNKDSIATSYLGSLYAARKRRMRPQKPFLNDSLLVKYDPEVLKLFLDCGPERDE